MGNVAGSFGQSFVNTLIQGQQIMAAVDDRREHLELQKKLAAAQLQEHDVKTQLATRALAAQSDLRSRLQPQEWQGSELSPGGSSPAAPLTDAERLSFSAALDPHGTAKELLAGGNRMTLKDMLTTQDAWVGGGKSGATPPAAPTAPPVQAPEPTTGEQPTPAPATGPATGVGPTTQLERSSSVTFDKDGHPKLELKVGEKKLSLSLHHEFEPLPDGRVQNYQITFNPGTGQQNRVPVGAPQLPDAQKAYAQTAVAWGLKPGSEMFAMAIAEQVAATTMYQGQAQTIALNDVREKYTSLAGGGAKGAPAAAPTASPTARAQAQEIAQIKAKTEAEVTARVDAQRAAPIGDDAVRYLNKRTLMHPDASIPRKDIEGSNDYTQVPPGQGQNISYLPVVKKTLEELEEIVMRRPDLFPPSTGKTMEDLGRVAKAAGKAKVGAKTDADIGRLNTLSIALPTIVKEFGDTGNVANAERAIAEAALGTQPSSREQALGRVDLIRSLVNAGTARNGLPPIPRKPGPKPAEVKVDEAQPNFILDLKTGKWMPLKP